MLGNYIEIDGEVLLVDDLTEWMDIFHASDHNVMKTNLPGIKISTVFLGIDHQYGRGPPILYETMVFGGQHDEYTERYPTRKEATSGHERIVKMVESSSPVIIFDPEADEASGPWWAS